MSDIENKKEFKIIKKENLYKGFFSMNKYSICHSKFGGGMTRVFERELLERGHAVAVVPYDPIKKKLVLIEQFRPGAMFDRESPWLIEVPAGIIDKNEAPEVTVERELQEETGLSCKEVKFISKFFISPGGCTETISLYTCNLDIEEEKVRGIHGLDVENEDIRVTIKSLEEALQMIENGEICNAMTIVGIQYIALHPNIFQ